MPKSEGLCKADTDIIVIKVNSRTKKTSFNAFIGYPKVLEYQNDSQDLPALSIVDHCIYGKAPC